MKQCTQYQLQANLHHHSTLYPQSDGYHIKTTHQAQQAQYDAAPQPHQAQQ